MPPQFRSSFYLSVALLALAARGAGAQETPSARYVDVSSLVIADSGETRVAERRVHFEYPLAERRAGIEAEFNTVFVVDTLGRVEMPTVTFGGGAPPAFRREICRWLAGVQFVPVVRDGARRRALMVEPFRFTVEGGSLAQQPIETGTVLRQAVIADGLPHTVRALEPLPHC
jgi:hypothetical protein